MRGSVFGLSDLFRGLFVYPCANTHCLDYCGFVIACSVVSLFFKTASAVLGPVLIRSLGFIPQQLEVLSRGSGRI